MRIPIKIFYNDEGRVNFTAQTNVCIPPGEYTIYRTGATVIKGNEVYQEGYIDYEVPTKNVNS